MQLELHFAVTREIFYPAASGALTGCVDDLLKMQEDIQECIAVLRDIASADTSETDSTMTRLMQLSGLYLHSEQSLLHAAERAIPTQLGTLGRQIIDRRKAIAGAVEDPESRN
jgi:hypothetical protein